MIAKPLFLVFAVAVLTCTTGNPQLAGIKCVVDGQSNASEKWSADHLEGKVYLSSHSGIATFESAPGDYLLKANHQLVLTRQYQQTNCPCCGGQCKSTEPESELSLSVGGTQIIFCSEDCKLRVQQAEDITAKARIVFSADAFERAFEKSAK